MWQVTVKCRDLKQHYIFIIPHSLFGSEVQEYSGLGSFRRLQVRCQPELQSPEGLPGAWRLCFQNSFQVGAGCWWEKVDPPLTGPSTDSLSVLMMGWATEQTIQGTARQKKPQCLLWTCLEVRYLPFCHILFARSKSLSPATLQGEGYSHLLERGISKNL